MTEEADAKRLFQAARDKPAGERAAFLDQACADPAVRKRIDALLAAEAELGAFLDEPAGRVPAPEPQLPEEGSGGLIDRYKLLQKIGEGGFGVVYMAEQTEPVRRKVAVKVLKPGMDSRQVIARFEAERQALALMDHPHIAHVLDAGATRLGHPYFVMELVKGVPITQYADEAKLDTRQRLELFQPVCQAVQHAHQKGIIHRDLKPSNILVTLHDGRPVPKVIDFGIAKATDHRLTEKTLFTEFRQMIGTPEYMAPEQAELSGLDVDTRADVYSLGVLLYELLTGKKPFDFETLLREGYGEILRHIREVEPPKPSTRVSTMGPEATVLAHQRHTEPTNLGRLLRGDLDWIVMKALEKDRSRRYETANALAMDVGRYLADEAVKATPPSRLYRARKYVRRHRTGVLAVGLVAASLVAGLIASTLGWMEADAQRDRAERREQEAATEAHRARAVVQLMKRLVGAADPDEVRGANFTVRELLADFDRELERGGLADEPEVAATMHGLLGGVYVRLGLVEEGERHLALARERGADVLPADHEVFTQALGAVARALIQRGHYEEADAAYREALAGTERRRGERSLEAARLRIAITRNLFDLARLDEAERALAQAVATLDLEPRRAPAERIDALCVRGGIERSRGDLGGAETQYREALAVARRAYGEEDPRTAEPLRQLALVLAMRGESEAAERMARRSLELATAQYGESHPTTAYAVNGLYLVLSELRRDEEALALARRELELKRRYHGESNAWVGIALNNVASALASLGRHDEAKPRFEEALAMQRAHYGEHPEMVTTLGNLTENARLRDDLPSAKRYLEQAFELAGRTLPTEHHFVAGLWKIRGGLYLREGDGPGAETAFRTALEICTRVFGDRSPRVVSAKVGLHDAEMLQGHAEDARALLEDALAGARALPDHWFVPLILSRMVAHVPPDEQVRMVKESLETSERLRGTDHWMTWERRVHLACTYHDVGDHASASDLFAQALPHLERLRRGRTVDERLAPVAKAAVSLSVRRHPQADAVRASLARALDATPRGWAYALLGRAALEAGRTDEARVALTRAESLLDPDDPRDLSHLAAATEALARVAAAAGDVDAVRRLQERLVTLQRGLVSMLEERGAEPHGILTAKLKLADILHTLGDDAAAAALFVDVLPHLDTLLPHPGVRLGAMGCALVAVQAGATAADVEAVVEAHARLRREHFPDGNAGCCREPERLLRGGHAAEAEPVLRGVLAALRRAYDHPCHDVLATSQLLSAALAAQGKREASVAEARRMLEEVQGRAGADELVVQATAFLARQVEGPERLQLLEQTASRSRTLYGPQHDVTGRHEMELALALADAQRWADAAPLFARVRSQLAAWVPEPGDRQPVLVSATVALLQAGHPDAPEMARALVALQRELTSEDDPELGLALRLLGDALMMAGRAAEAISAYRRALETGVGDLPERDARLLTLRYQLALALRATDRRDESAALLRDVLRLVRAQDPGSALAAEVANYLGTVLPDEQAVALYTEAVEIAGRLEGPEGPTTRAYRLNLAMALGSLGRTAAAAEGFAPLLAGLRALAPDALQRIRILTTATSCLLDEGHPQAAQAVAMVREARLAHLAGSDDERSTCLLLEGRWLVASGNHADAEPLLREAVAIRERRLPADSWLLANARSLLGEALLGQRRFLTAERLLVEAYEGMRPPPQWTRRRTEALERVVALYEAWSKPEKAAAWRARAAQDDLGTTR